MCRWRLLLLLLRRSFFDGLLLLLLHLLFLWLMPRALRLLVQLLHANRTGSRHIMHLLRWLRRKVLLLLLLLLSGCRRCLVNLHCVCRLWLAFLLHLLFCS